MPVKKRSTRSRKTPPLNQGKHSLTHAQAQEARFRFLTFVGPELDLAAPLMFGRGAFEKVLGGPEVRGVRVYPAVGEDGAFTLMFCGVDARGNDVLATVIGGAPFRCPPWRSAPNGVLQP